MTTEGVRQERFVADFRMGRVSFRSFRSGATESDALVHASLTPTGLRAAFRSKSVEAKTVFFVRCKNWRPQDSSRSTRVGAFKTKEFSSAVFTIVLQ